MGAVLLILFVLLILAIGVIAIVAVLKSHKNVKERPQTLAHAAAPLGLQPVADAEGMARWAFQGTILQEMPRIAAVVQGQTAMGHVTVVETVHTSGGRVRHEEVETMVVFYGTSNLPRLVIQPSSHEWPVHGLTAIDFSEADDEHLAAFGFSYSVHTSDVHAVRALMTPALAAHFNRLDDADKAPAIEVLQDRILCFVPRKQVEASQLGTYLSEAFACVQTMMGAMPR